MILAQRDVEDEGWMNILVVIVMIVFWMVGGIIKAMKTKSDQQQQPSRVPARKRPAPRRAATRQSSSHPTHPPVSTQHPQQSVQPRRTTLADLRAAARKFAAEAEQAFQQPSPAQKSTPEYRPRLQTTEPDFTPDSTVSTEPVVEAVKALGQERSDSEEDISLSQLKSDLLSDYTDPDKLRRAILHYEILGPPLSLRD